MSARWFRYAAAVERVDRMREFGIITADEATAKRVALRVALNDGRL